MSTNNTDNVTQTLKELETLVNEMKAEIDALQLHFLPPTRVNAPAQNPPEPPQRAQ